LGLVSVLFSLRFPHQKPVHASPLSNTSYMPRLSHCSRCYHPHNRLTICKWIAETGSHLHGTKTLGNKYGLEKCFPTFSTSRYPWPRSSYLTVPLEENTYFLNWFTF
jgi:hypothetical protein